MVLDQYLKPIPKVESIEFCKVCEAKLSESEIKSNFRLCGHRICAICQIFFLMNQEKIARILAKKEELLEEDLAEEPEDPDMKEGEEEDDPDALSDSDL